MNISYAQNYEDILIWRLFKNSPPGFYVDVGAAHPIKDSVSLFFYKKNWSGLNVEPNKNYHQLLKKNRPRDINICCAVSDQEGEMPFNFVVNDPKLSSLETLPEQLIKEHQLQVEKLVVPVTTLEKLIETHHINKIDFLKIDAEGAEEKILKGFPFSKIQPRLIVIESVEQKGTRSTQALWQDLLLSQNYICVYFDGSNSYFVKKSDAEAQDLYKIPLNASDDFARQVHFRWKNFIKARAHS